MSVSGETSKKAGELMTTLRGLLQRVLLRAAPLFGASSLLSGCAAAPEPPGAAALHRMFPEQASLVLLAREVFVSDAEGFHLHAAATSGRARRLHVVLPREGSEPIRFRTPEGTEVLVRELGALGESAPVEWAVAYARVGGTSFWTATEHGVEEWLLLEAGIARGEEAVAAWEVEGATLRARGAAVEVVDEQSGAAVLRVTAPRAYAASGRLVAATLTARGARIELSIDAGGEAVLVDPAWAPAGVMNEPRMLHTAHLLQSGQVLVAGGAASGALDSAELYDPATDAWTLAARMGAPRVVHTSTLLQSGQVLVAGGLEDVSSLGWVYFKSAELYDPEADTWTPAGEMMEARARFTATLLPSGLVLMAGGTNNESLLNTAELFDPRTGASTATGSMTQARVGHTATLLPSGLVLVAGGDTEAPVLDSAELYDPAIDRWTAAARMAHARTGHTATLLPSGHVLVTGGGGEDNSSSATDIAELYDPASGTWTVTDSMSYPRRSHTATLLPSGHVLVAGGYNANVSLETAELYDPDTGTFADTSSMALPRAFHTATLLPTGEVLVAGGSELTSERFGIARGQLCPDPAAVCLFGDVCVDGICCDAPCPCGACSSAGHCGPGGSPVKAGSECAPPRCDGETHSLLPALCTAASSTCPEQERVACIAYRCDPERGTCRSECASLDDCALGFVCNLRGHCVLPPSAAPGAAGACSPAPGRPSSSAAYAAGVALVALAAARRRRPLGRRRSC